MGVSLSTYLGRSDLGGVLGGAIVYLSRRMDVPFVTSLLGLGAGMEHRMLPRLAPNRNIFHHGIAVFDYIGNACFLVT